MIAKLASACLVATALVLPVVSHAADSDADRASPKAFVKDSYITTKIKAELFEEKLASLLHISVDTDKKGHVMLGGTADTKADADKAETIARRVKGVTGVQNNIKVKADK